MQMGDARNRLVELVDGRCGHIYGVVVARIERDLEMSIRGARPGRQQTGRRWTGLAAGVPEARRGSFEILARLGAEIGLEYETIVANSTEGRGRERRRIDRRD